MSPQNVWFDDRHEAHLGDFDSAITAAGTDDLRPLTTNSFAAPEEQEGRALDVRTDLYSLGGVLYVIAASTVNAGRKSSPTHAERSTGRRMMTIPADNRDLNYARYFTEGQKEISALDDYTSHNTERLSVPQLKDLLLKLDFVQGHLRDRNAAIAEI